MPANDCVHAAGAFNIDFKTSAAARSRATSGSALAPHVLAWYSVPGGDFVARE